jgi:hypothetical protein
VDIWVVDLHFAAMDFDKLYGQAAVALAGLDTFQGLICRLGALVEKGWVVVLGLLGRFGYKMGYLS